MSEKLTTWKKNIDARYISGEDLKDGEVIGKGLKPEMIVEIVSFNDVATYDKVLRGDVAKTGIYLKEVNGAKLYKPVVLNKTNAEFCEKEFGSQFMEHWIGKAMVLWAMPDSRFGYVARFKKHFAQVVVDEEGAKTKLNAAKTKEELGSVWLNDLTKDERTNPSIAALKDKLKESFK